MRTWKLLFLSSVLLAATAAVLLASSSSRDASANPMGGLVAVAAAEDHTCAITDSGAVRCWGSNRAGQLGNGRAVGSRSRDEAFPSAPVQLDGVVRKLGPGTSHSCAVLEDGSLWCWGDNGHAELGQRDMERTNVPVDVQGLSGPVLDAGGGVWYTCALVEGGLVECWGDNEYGQLGSPASSGCDTYDLCEPEPQRVEGIENAVGLSIGALHACAVTTQGAVYCWGYNAAGQLGDGTTTARHTPAAVPGITGVIQVAAGSEFTCALTDQSTVACWGQGYGNSAADVPGLQAGVEEIRVSGTHGCARLSSGGVKCWGDNGLGQLGDGGRCGGVCREPVDVVGLGSGVVPARGGSSSQLRSSRVGQSEVLGRERRWSAR